MPVPNTGNLSIWPRWSIAMFTTPEKPGRLSGGMAHSVFTREGMIAKFLDQGDRAGSTGGAAASGGVARQASRASRRRITRARSPDDNSVQIPGERGHATVRGNGKATAPHGQIAPSISSSSTPAIEAPDLSPGVEIVPPDSWFRRGAGARSAVAATLPADGVPRLERPAGNHDQNSPLPRGRPAWRSLPTKHGGALASGTGVMPVSIRSGRASIAINGSRSRAGEVMTPVAQIQAGQQPDPRRAGADHPNVAANADPASGPSVPNTAIQGELWLDTIVLEDWMQSYLGSQIRRAIRAIDGIGGCVMAERSVF
jgi:hypothetical protein